MSDLLHLNRIKNHGLRITVSYLLIALGAAMAGFSVACILIPNGAMDFGTIGLSILISRLGNWNLTLCMVIVLTPFLVLGYLFLGPHFGSRATLGAIVYIVSLTVFEHVPFELNTENYLAVAFGGAILGAGLSLILRNGGCVDGSEILANILVKKLSARTGRDYGMTPILIGFNVILYVAVFVLIDRTTALMSLLVYVVATVLTDHFTDHYESVKQVTIHAADAEPIVQDIREHLNKTCTITESRGAVGGANETIVCYVNYFELQEMRYIIEKYRDCSFCTVSTIDELID